MKQVVARLVEMAAPSEFIPMRTLVTKAGGTAALRKMSHSKAAIALKNAAKELQAERKAKGLGWKLDKAQAQEWLDTNTPKRAPGSGGVASSKRRGSSSKAGKAGKQGSSLPPRRKSIAQIKRERRGKEYTPLTRKEAMQKAREGRKRGVDKNGNPIQFNGFTERDYGKW